MEEFIDICDENNKLTGEKVTKKQAHKQGLWHRATHVWIYNSKGEILIQLRAKENKLYPNYWDISVAGHVSSNEDPITTAVRETKEEIGLNIKEKDLEFLEIRKASGFFKEIKNNEFNYVYLIKFDVDINNLDLQKEEVKELKFMNIDELKNEIKKDNSNFVPHGNYWDEIILEVKKRTS
jgi:isopentenyl-diphosphate Delta-isomerase